MIIWRRWVSKPRRVNGARLRDGRSRDEAGQLRRITSRGHRVGLERGSRVDVVLFPSHPRLAVVLVFPPGKLGRLGRDMGLAAEGKGRVATHASFAISPLANLHVRASRDDEDGHKATDGNGGNDRRRQGEAVGFLRVSLGRVDGLDVESGKDGVVEADQCTRIWLLFTACSYGYHDYSIEH